jgi:7-cyano-7-deazaguanine synthase
MSKALVILSGGQDSTTCLFWALAHHDEVYALTFDYGQRHRIEIDAAIKVAQMGGVTDHKVVSVPECLLSVSPLVESSSELEQYENPHQMEQVIGDRREITFVPMRNALFLTIAANHAEFLDARDIYIGVCQMDNANYDDCRRSFISAAELYINTALGHDHRNESRGWIRLQTPLLNMTKEQTVHLAYSNPACWAAMAYTHTSYDGKYPPTDMNHANVLRADGFEKAGRPDPLVLRAHSEGLMDLPATANYDGHR